MTENYAEGTLLHICWKEKEIFEEFSLDLEKCGILENIYGQ